jgi:hypothetical protein
MMNKSVDGLLTSGAGLRLMTSHKFRGLRIFLTISESSMNHIILVDYRQLVMEDGDIVQKVHYSLIRLSTSGFLLNATNRVTCIYSNECANLLVRILTNDDPNQARRAVKIRRSNSAKWI